MAEANPKSLLREIPSISKILEHDQTKSLIKEYGRDLVVNFCQGRIDSLRAQILGGKDIEKLKSSLDISKFMELVKEDVSSLSGGSLKSVLRE